MSIPALNADGFLPEGIHDCTPQEIRDRFGQFQDTDRRPRFWTKLRDFLLEARASNVIVFVIVDGSFVTAKPDPNDIDLILVVSATHDFRADLTPDIYNVISKRKVRDRHGFDLLVARLDSAEYMRYVEFLQQVRLQPGLRKGILRVRL